MSKEIWLILNGARQSRKLMHMWLFCNIGVLKPLQDILITNIPWFSLCSQVVFCTDNKGKISKK